MKLNVEKIVFFDNNKAGIGVILRNAEGNTLFAASLAERGEREPKDIELLAIFRGLQICLRMGIRRIMVESDCLLMIQEYQAKGTLTSILGHLILEIKRLQEDFEEYFF